MTPPPALDPLNRRRWLTRTGVAAAACALPAFVHHVRADGSPRFALGIASGQPSADGVVLWTRLTGLDLPDQVEVHWEIADDEAFTRGVRRGRETADAAWAHSVHAEPRGLAPDRWYFYRFEALGQRSAVGRTRTAPAADAMPAPLRLAIASCQRWDHGHYAAWRHVAGEGNDLVLFLGDYIYEYPSGPNVLRPHDGGLTRTLAQYRARYAQYKSDPALQAAHAACPWLLVWDDHEVENDYANDRGTHASGEAFLKIRAAAYQAWWEHQPVPKAMRPVGPDARIYQRLDWGRLARLHLVDDRQYRDPQACVPLFRLGGSTTVALKDCPALLDPQRTLLGAAQERWLAEGWDRERPWNLLAQQTLMARMSWRDPAAEPTYWTDGWDGYPAARQRLLQGIAERGLGGAVVLGGDVHAHYVADLKTDFDDARAPVVATEFCGSSISSRGMAQSRLDEALRHNPHIRLGRSDVRGTIGLTLDGKSLKACLMRVQRADDPLSPVDELARFVVEAGRPGAQTA